MSLKKLRNKLAGKSEPRSIDELKKAYQALAAQAATCQYTVYVNDRELLNINEQMRLVNIEASERQALDKSVADEKAKQEKA